MKYEIEPRFFEGYHFESEISTLTGLELEEILPHTKDITRWSGSTYVKLFRKLGFNCNPKFKKFDRETPYPCIMRTKKPKVKQFWYGFIYYDNKIYIQEDVLTWEEWNAMYPNYRITSMLQVWV